MTDTPHPFSPAGQTPPVPALLRVRDLHFAWPQGVLFDSLSFDLPPGVSLVQGDDGSGKSTLLALLAGQRPAQRGSLQVGSAVLHEAPEAYRRQVFWIDPQTDALDAITATAWLDSLAPLFPHLRADELADLIEGFGIEPHLHKPLYMLSTGSKRKVWLCAAFAAGAPLTLIDQPFAALDGPSMRFLRSLLQEAASHPSRAWLLADHAPPDDVPLARVITL